MALGNPSSTPETQADIKLSNESQERVDLVTKDAIAVLESNPDTERAVGKLFGDMVSKNLRSPENIAKIQDGLYEARDERLKKAHPDERLSILESFSAFMQNFTQWIAQMHRDVSLSNEANMLRSGSDAKIAQVQSTYEKIIVGNHPTLTA